MLYGFMLDIMLATAPDAGPRTGEVPRERTPMKTRKELARAYRENPPPPGVWSVHCLGSGRRLLGASLDARGSLNRMRMELETGVMPNAALLADWRSHGPEQFVFETLDTLKPDPLTATRIADDLKELEDLWRERFPAAERYDLSARH